jgi:hypothetical protein
LTETPTPVPVYQTLNGVVAVEQIACRRGPGEPYLYLFGLIMGNKMKLHGRMEVQSLGASTTWLFGLPQGYEDPCWVNAKNIELDGDVSSLQPDYYPDNAPLLLFHNKNFPPPTDVKAVRDGDQVTITWTGYTLAPSDLEDKGRPMSLAETWTCQGGKIVFTPLPAYEAYGSAKVIDEAGCSTASHGQVFIAHKDGYVGPVPVDWPEHP